MRRTSTTLVLAAAVALAAGAVAGGSGGRGDAVLWVTRDEGAHVLLDRRVGGGLTVLQTLERAVGVRTTYGGRYVEAVDGLAGSLSKRRDWFFFVNGRESDRGAAEVVVRPGDVVWWDYRYWGRQMEVPAVVGAFPDPFVRGFGGGHRPLSLRYPTALAAPAAALRRLLDRGGGHGAPNVFELDVRAGATGATLVAEASGGSDSPTTFRLSGSLRAVRAAALALARRPSLVAHRFRARFDEDGRPAR